MTSSSATVNGSQDGSRTTVSGVLAARPQLGALMFAGIVRLRHWALNAPTLAVLDTPG
jgi:hypothetical protein